MTTQERDDIKKLKRAVDLFAQQMKIRLLECAKRGKTGWDGDYPEEDLLRAMSADADDLLFDLYGDADWKQRTFIDVANRAMMGWWRNSDDAKDQPDPVP